MTVTGPDLVILHCHDLWLVSQPAGPVSVPTVPAATRSGLAIQPV